MEELTCGSIRSYIEIIEHTTMKPKLVLNRIIQNYENALNNLSNSDFWINTFLNTSNNETENIEISKLKKYCEILFKIKIKNNRNIEQEFFKYENNSTNSVLPKFKFYYRGHYSNRFNLLPSAFRFNADKEDYYYNEILTRNPNEFIGSSHLQRLVKMQHYDCPTRLLDITSNPLVALYFACKNMGCKICDSCNVGEVYIFAPFERDILSFDSDRALILSCLPKFSIAAKKEIFNECINCFMQNRTLSENNNSTLDKFYHEIRREFPSFLDKIQPIDLLSSFFVQPIKDNSRIIKQEGAFIICGQYYNNESLVDQLNSMAISRIKIINKKKILKELDALGINEASLFPELDKVSHYLKNR